MTDNLKADTEVIKKEIRELKKVLKGAAHLLIVVHNNPDPDAIGSAAALAFLAEKKFGLQSSISYGGNIGRAENKEMVRKLNIRMKRMNRVNLDKYDRIALVDTQIGAGNNALDENAKCDIVIDHHPKSGKVKARLEVIKPKIGVSSTILVEWLQYSEIEIPPDLATALSYAITSETQSLGRETTQRDIQAYLSVYTRSSMRKLAQIMHPKLTRTYFKIMDRTLQNAFIYRHLLYSHLRDVPAAEMVSEMADFLLRLERISWIMCTGRVKDQLIIALRSSNPNAKAGELLKSLVPDSRTVGGHDMIAGGYVQLDQGKKQELMEMEINITKKFAQQQGYDNVEWKSLLNSIES
jgi:nanoRNase/pAp phosphatase (c-di-AMP/oligoRNAs hydrolase)